MGLLRIWPYRIYRYHFYVEILQHGLNLAREKTGGENVFPMTSTGPRRNVGLIFAEEIMVELFKSEGPCIKKT